MTSLKSFYVDGGIPKESDFQALRSDRVARLSVQMELLKTRLKIAVVYGGDKSVNGAVINPTNNPRAWKSYKSVAEDIASALKRLGFRYVDLMPEDMHLGERLRDAGTHFAWLNTGGVQGRNPMAHAASTLEMVGIPYLGHDPLTAGILDNKHVFKRELQALGLPTAPFYVSYLNREPGAIEEDPSFRATFGDYEGPFIVKPTTGRASLNVQFVPHRRDLAEMVDDVRTSTGNHVLVEKYLSGREYCVAVCGPVVAHDGGLARMAEPFVFATVERVLDTDERIFTSKDVRPITADRIRLLSRPEEGPLIDDLDALARNVFRGLNLESLVRLDIRADENGELYVLEANPKPDLAAPKDDGTSLVCANLDAYGMTYDDLVFSLIADRFDHILNGGDVAGARLNLLLRTI